MRAEYNVRRDKTPKELDQLILENLNKDTTFIGEVYMYLPQEGIDNWKKKIEANPILIKNNTIKPTVT